MSTSGVVCVVVGLWVQLSLAHYSLYISEDKLQSYYADSVYAELVQGIYTHTKMKWCNSNAVVSL